MLGFLSGCVQMNPIANIQSSKIRSADQHVVDSSNHDAIARHYEDVAKEMKAKLRIQRQLLEEYEKRSYFYGARGQDLRSRTSANIRYYENSIKANLKEAIIHRKIAQDKEERNFTTEKHDLILVDERDEEPLLN